MKSRKPRKILARAPRRRFGSSRGDALTTNQWKTFERYGYLGVALSLLILVVISSTSYQSIVRIQNDFKWVTHTREVLLNLSYFLSDLKDAEMGQRAYLLTGQESYLEPYQYVRKGVKYHFANLRTIATDNVVQQKKLDVLEILVIEQLSKLEELVALQKDKGVEAAKQAIITGDGKKIMDDIQTLILEMDKSEKEMLKQRAKMIAARVKYDIVVKSIGIILILVTAMLFTSGARRWVAERKRAEKKQMDKVNIKSDFISTVSHELRTPFKAIRESITIILDESAGPVNNEQKKFLIVAKRNVDRLAKLINNVLDIQKLDSGKMEFSICDNDINEVVKEVYELMEPSAEKKGLSIITKLESQLPKLRFDKDKILQVLTNIVDNAIKFTEKGNITITTDTQENAVLVSTRDTGPGVAKEDLPRLFNRFEQVSNSKHRRSVGTGLGLAISKEIIRRHNGKIWAESGLGRGTAICFKLPINKHRTNL